LEACEAGEIRLSGPVESRRPKSQSVTARRGSSSRFATAGPSAPAAPNRSAQAYSEHGRGLGFEVATERQAPVLLQRGAYENVVIDTRGRPSRQDLREIGEGCDFLVVPTPPEALALRSLMELSELFEKMEVRWRVVLTMVLAHPVKDGSEAREALEGAGIPLFSS